MTASIQFSVLGIDLTTGLGLPNYDGTEIFTGSLPRSYALEFCYRINNSSIDFKD